MIELLCSGRTVGTKNWREEKEIQLELQKEILREEIVAEEIERLRFLESELRRDLILDDHEMSPVPRSGGVPSSPVVGQPVEPEYGRIAMPTPERDDGSGRDIGGFEAVSFRWISDSEIISLGKSSHLKRKAREAAAKGEFSCAVCQISAPSEGCLNRHFSGKKHLAKTAAMNTCSKKIIKEHKKSKIYGKL